MGVTTLSLMVLRIVCEVMREHYSAEGEMPDETVSGEQIEYGWIVLRTPRDSKTGSVEILGIHTDEGDARQHAKVAESAGETELRREVIR